MSEFDLKRFLNNRAAVGFDKIQAVRQASEEKVRALQGYAAQIEQEHAQDTAQFNKSVVGILSNNLGLDKDGVVADAINKSVIMGNSMSRAAGFVGSGAWDLLGSAANQHLPDEVKAARGRQLKGEATPADLELLSLPAGDLVKKNYPKGTDYETNAERIGRMERYFQNAKDVRGFFDLSDTVDQRDATKLQREIVANSPEGVAQIKSMMDLTKEGEYAAALKAAGRAALGLAPGVLKAGADNPNAVVNTVLDQTANLASGGAGKAAVVGMNAFYGLDAYGQGIQGKIAANKGEMPSDTEMASSAKYGALAAGAELVGDKVTGIYSMAQGLRKGAQEAVTGSAKKTFKESLLGLPKTVADSSVGQVAKAAAGGFVGEGLTEGVQTYLEAAAKGKEARAEEIAIGAGIGGLSGAAMSGGISAAQHLTGNGEKQVAKRAEEAAKTEAFVENSRTNNADAYLDSKSKAYDPAKAVAVLYAHSQRADVTPEAKQQNVEKAHDIIAGLETKRSELKAQIDGMTPQGIQSQIDSLKSQKDELPPAMAPRIDAMIKALETDLADFKPADPKAIKGVQEQIKALDRQIKQSTKLRDQVQADNTPDEEVIAAAVEQADAPVDVTTPETSKNSVAHVLSLAMSHPDSFSEAQLARLANNQNNGLSQEQRNYFSSVAQARAAERAFKDMKGVAREVMFGDPVKNQLGIADYKQRMQAALASRNEQKAASAVHMLGKFAKGHSQKLRFFVHTFNQAGKTGKVNVIPTPTGWQVAPTQDLSEDGQKANREKGGVTISARSVKLIRQIQTEAKALTAAHAQLQATYALRFTPQQTQQAVPPVAQTTVDQSTATQVVDSSVPSQPSQPVQAAPANTTVDTVDQSNQPTTVETHSNVDSTVDSPVETTKPKRSRQRIEPKDYQNIIGAILKVTGGAGISAKVARDLLGDKTKELKNVRPAVRANGWQDIGQLISYLREAGYTQLNTEEDLVNMLRDHMNGIPGYTAAKVEENAAAAEARKAKAEEKAFRKTVNQEAKQKGIKQARGKRTLDDVLADLAKWEEELSRLEAEEERAAIQAESLMNETSEAELMQAVAEEVGYTQEEIENVRNINRQPETGTVEDTQGTSQESDGNRDAARQAEEGKAADGEAGKLSVFRQVGDLAGKKFGEAFKAINLIAHNLTQNVGTGKATQRPLVAVEGFLSKWSKGEIAEQDIQAFLGANTTEAQREYLDHFLKVTTGDKGWLANITNNLVKGQTSAGIRYKEAVAKANGDKAALAEIEKKYAGKKPGDVYFSAELRYTNPIQYLIELDASGKADMEENVKAAIATAAFMYVAENAGELTRSTDEQVKAMFGIGEYEDLDPGFIRQISSLGTMENAAILSMGQKVTQALGITAKKGATKDFLPRLEADMGAHVLKLLVDQGIIERNRVDKEDISKALGHVEGHNSENQGDIYFVRMARTKGKTFKERRLNAAAQRISDLSKGTQGVLTKLFGVESSVKEPSWEPITGVQKTTNKTDQEVPDFQKEIIKHENSVANHVREDVWHLLQQIGEDAFLQIAGFETPDASRMHHTTVASIEASNEALVRELYAAVDYFGTLENAPEYGGSPLGLKQPLYLAHSVWKQQRVGIDGVINPQSSKIHRWMLTRADWATEVSSTDLDNFFLRVGEGLGVKTDKQGNPKSLAEIQALFDTTVADTKVADKAKARQAAIDALERTLRGTPLTADTAAIVAGVQAGGEKMHSLDALMAMAEYQKAMKDAGGKPFTFTVRLMGEVDGVTNGPMLSHLLMGAASSAKNLLTRLNRGGFFEQGQDYQNYNVWRGDTDKGHFDLYETTIGSVINVLGKMPEQAATFARLQKITGVLKNATTGKIEKAGRNIIKTPLTAMLFGSAVNGAVKSMFRDFVAKTYEGFEAIAKMDADKQEQALREYVSNLNALLQSSDVTTTPIQANSLEHFLQKFELETSQMEALEQVFNASLGAAVTQTMKTAYAPFLAMRDTVNQAANTTFGMYNAAHTTIRRAVIAELMASGEIAQSKAKDPKALHDLTPEQEALIEERIAALNPEVQTYMSSQSKNTKGSGLHISKSDRKISKETAYANISRFSNPLHAANDEKGFGILSLGNAAFQRMWDAPGVAMVPMMIHSLDSAISHIALMGRQVLNVHDAHGTGLGGFVETARALNAATWKAVLGYSPATEMKNAFEQTLKGMDALLKTNLDRDIVAAELRKTLVQLGKDQGQWVEGNKIAVPAENVLEQVALGIYFAAAKADRIKLETMSQLQFIDQYALEGGQYEVTEADRKEALAMLGKVGDGAVPGSIWATIDRINEAALGIKVTPVTSEYGHLGTPSIRSDEKLVTFFEDKNQRTAKEVIAEIKGQVSPANRYLLNKIAKLVDPDMPVTMLTARTPEGKTLTKEAGARGWFAATEKAAAVYVLSPEFVMSGLTPELLVHELVHAALAKTIDRPNTLEAKALVKSLTGMANVVNAYLDANPDLLAKYPMKLDAQELVAWGMSDLGFQRDVLAHIPMTKSTVSNKFMSVMMEFIKTLSKFLGLPLTTKNGEDNALAALIQDVSGLFEEAKNGKNGLSTEAGTTSLAMTTIQNMTTQNVFEALDEGKVAPTFKAHLENVLESIANKLHGPYGTFKALVEQKIAPTPKDLWQQAQGQGKAPFGSAALAAGIPMNDQVAFVLEQVEASVNGALEANVGTAHDVYVELDKLYKEAHTKLANDLNLSQDLRDFLFKMDMGQGGRTRHLARFAAMGIAHPEVNAALKTDTNKVSIDKTGGFAHRLETTFQKALEWFNGRLTHTYAGQQADEKLTVLVSQLVEIEARRKEPMLQKASTLDFVENSLKAMAASAKDKVEKAGRSPWVRNRKNSVIRATGSMVSTIAGDRAEALMNTLQSVRDRQMNEGHGLAMGVLNEIRGMNDGNAMFHRLIREAKLREGTREDLIIHTGNVALEGFANKGKDLTQAEKAAISAGLLRTDIAALLAHHTMDEVTRLLTDTQALDQEVARLEAALAPYRKVRGYYERYAKNLGYKLATGKVKGMNTMMNATNIARLVGTGKGTLVTEADAQAAVPIIDQLASLYAYRYVDPAHKQALKSVLKTEAARGKENGVEMVLRLHQSLQTQSRERLFEGTESLMMKGYTSEIYDPKKEVLVATEADGEKLEAQGYIKGKQVATDPLDPDKKKRFVFKRDGGGLRPWLSGIVSYTGETAKGSRSKTDNVKTMNEWKANQSDLRRMEREKRAAMQGEFRYDPNYDPSKVRDNFAAPVVNPKGDVVGYRYLMSEENKDTLLNRDNRFDKVLGAFAGNIYDKESTKENNRKAIQALHDQYKADFATRAESYRKVGPDSSDPELQDIYRMLPEDTKQAIQQIWGTPYMLVRSDLMDINFGYRKVSVTNAFQKEHKDIADKLFVGLATAVLGEKAEYHLRRVEDVIQEIATETKEILVIKNLSTLLGNIGSNISLLYWQGVPLKDMARYHRVALKGVSSYREDSAALTELEIKLAAGIITTSRAEMSREILRLKDALANNPVKELIDAGLMPSIVEDVSPDDDMYSYKSRLTQYVNDHTNKLNKHVVGAAKVVYMAKDTKMYKALHHATQLSDFVARYALYAHVTTRKDSPMGKEAAVQLASDSFVNYDIPSHRKLQYMNDMGFVRFTKYYLRIQKVIAHLYAESPGRAMALLATEAFFSKAPVLTESGFTHHLGNNPFEKSAVDYLGTLDQLATIKTAKLAF